MSVQALTTIPTDSEADFAAFVGQTYDDPLLHVQLSYPWGKGVLKGRQPDAWHIDFLTELGNEVKKRAFDGVHAVDPIRFSTASGHGIGKSTLVSWLIRWILDTRPMSKGIVTANTSEQLRTKTWGELAKWHAMGMTRHWWQLNSGAGALSIYHVHYREQWRCDAQTCREENSEAFAGLHAASSTPFYIFDEASAVPDKIYEVREGGTTDGEPFIFDFGNPTRNSGMFFENMIGRHRNRYIRRQIDSRDVEITNKRTLQEWIEAYGEDSDFVRVRVKGIFPKAGSLQFIPLNYYEDNVNRDVVVTPQDPLIIGVDVARFGDDRSVIWTGRGRDLATYPPQIYSEVDTVNLAGLVADHATKLNPDAIFVDGGGVGGGVVDQLRRLGFAPIEINFGAKASLPGFADMRAQCWGRMKEALRDGVRLPDLDDLRSDLTGVEYGYDIRNNIRLERKEDMKKRGLASPDLADAMSLIYAMPVSKQPRAGYNMTIEEREYDPFD